MSGYFDFFFLNRRSNGYEFKDYIPDNFSPVDFSKNELQPNILPQSAKQSQSVRKLDTLEAPNS